MSVVSKTFSLSLACTATIGAFSCFSSLAIGAESWITTWAASPQGRWNDELPAPFGIAEALENQTVRRVARVSVGGQRVRIVLSNEFGSKPLVIGAGSVGLAGKDGAIEGAVKPLTWSGQSSVTIPPGAPMISDPVDLPVEALGSLSVSIFLPRKAALSTVHWDGVQTAYISEAGDFTKEAAFKAQGTTKARLFLSAIAVDAKPDSQAIVFFGDSITDGNCSTPDANRRWPDVIAERLQKDGHKDVAVVNEAISGNRVLSDGMGINALARFDDDVLDHPRVKTVVVMEGINDIGWPGEGAITPDDKMRTKEEIVAGYQQLIDRAKAHDIRIIAATLTPFTDTFKGLPTEGYYTPEKEKIRQAVNEWIRTSKAFDGVIDFDKTVEDPSKPGYINPAYDCGDHLHPNDAGYKVMGESVDLNLLLGK
jgi:lysophospholipase L1-like esterase